VAGGRWQVAGVENQEPRTKGAVLLVAGGWWQVAGGRWQVAGGRWQVSRTKNQEPRNGERTEDGKRETGHGKRETLLDHDLPRPAALDAPRPNLGVCRVGEADDDVDPIGVDRRGEIDGRERRRSARM
jgi:hypothetical protein